MKKNFITISIPVYNRFTFFEEAIQSALNQTVKCGIAVVDNDSEHTKFEKYVRELKNPLVSYHRNNENLGMIGNWNRCVEVVDTPWISILHDDDILHPEFIETIQGVIEGVPDCGLIATRAYVDNFIPDTFYKNDDPAPELKEITPAFYLFRNLSPFPGVAFKKSLFKEAGGFDPSYHPISDLDFWYRISKETKTIFMDNELAFYRISEEQETSSRFSELIEKTRTFRERVYKENDMKGPLHRLSLLKANQDLIDYYNERYPESKLENEKFARFLKFYPVTKLLDHINRKNAYKNK